MRDSVLTQQQAVALLRKLSSDDTFRATYKAAPSNALLLVGVTQDIIDGMPPGSLPPLRVLAEKAVFLAALIQVEARMAEVCVCFHAPNIRFNFGS